MILKNDNGKELPKKVQKKVNDFIDNLKNVKWFKPSPDLKKTDVDKQIKFTLKCFGVEADIEYRKLEKKVDWDSAWASAWASALDSARASARDSAGASAWDSALDSAGASAWDSALDSAWDSALDSALDSARASALDSAGVSAWDSAGASQEILLEDDELFKKKYPNGAFRQLFKLWEMGLYPVGVLDKKFVIYVPLSKIEFPNNLIK